MGCEVGLSVIGGLRNKCFGVIFSLGLPELMVKGKRGLGRPWGFFISYGKAGFSG